MPAAGSDIQPDQFTKDPNAVLSYRFVWGQWLDTGDTITGATILVDDTSAVPVVVDATSHTDETVTVVLSGGTAGTAAKVTCRVSTTNGLVDDRTVTLRIRER